VAQTDHCQRVAGDAEQTQRAHQDGRDDEVVEPAAGRVEGARKLAADAGDRRTAAACQVSVGQFRARQYQVILAVRRHVAVPHFLRHRHFRWTTTRREVGVGWLQRLESGL